MHTMWQDVRYSLRMLGKYPGFTAIAVLTLAMGIGANTAIFSILNAVLLQPLPYPEPQRLMAIWGTDSVAGETHRALSYPDFADLRNQSHTLEAVAAFDDGTFTLTGSDEPYHVHVSIVSANLLSVLRVAPELGSGYAATDDKPGTRVVLLSHAIWKTRFGGAPGILGQSILLDGQKYSVAGIMPASFQFPLNSSPVDMWTTMAVVAVSSAGDPPITTQRGAHFLGAIGRLKPGVTLAQANADTVAISAGLASQYPDDNGHLGMAVEPEIDALVGDVRSAILLMLGAVGFLLLIACANVANLLLARAAAREREMAVRTAMGASRWRILRQLLTESVLMSFAGGLAGLLLAPWATKFFANLESLQIPRLAHARIDVAALAFMLAVSVFTGLLFGLAPAWHASKLEVSNRLKDGGRTATEGARHTRIRNLLVVSEVAIALVLLIGATLMGESLMNLWVVSPGFDPKGVLAFDINLPDVHYVKREQAADFYRRLLDRIKAVPGVEQASAIFPLPLSDSRVRTTFEIEGKPVAKSDEPRTHFRAVGLGYFSAMRIPLLAGREFTNRDTRTSAPVVIVNETLAKKFFPSENPIGKRIKPDVAVSGEPTMREIVGVVGDVKHQNLWQTPDPESYMPFDQVPIGDMTLVVRTSGNPLQLLPAMREQVRELDPEIPVFRPKTLEEYVKDSVAQRRFTGVVCGIFAAAGLILAVVGLYGVMSYTVAQRTHEMGVRVAIGARKQDILKLVLAQGVGLTLAGIVIGVLGSLALTRFIYSQLFGVPPTDPRTFVGVVIVLLGATAAACYFPARRATHVDPMVALRYA